MFQIFFQHLRLFEMSELRKNGRFSCLNVVPDFHECDEGKARRKRCPYVPRQFAPKQFFLQSDLVHVEAPQKQTHKFLYLRAHYNFIFAPFDLFRKFSNFTIVFTDRGRLHCAPRYLGGQRKETKFRARYATESQEYFVVPWFRTCSFFLRHSPTLGLALIKIRDKPCT